VARLLAAGKINVLELIDSDTLECWSGRLEGRWRASKPRGQPSLITRHNKPEAVVLGFAEWERLSRVPSFGRLLMSAPLEADDVPARNRAPTRDPGL
jgi:antitoxin (DNA-binding transcriptional repressor) of toxin-antitoxin stability system